ncbi:receptor-type tyrosine-protein phosphatase T-like, partial [Argopecten irradians]|uniref:receptor-type tyrosine-protein phosphatase T-like n=1 Tax=Argopecten irradians TaxID=31199 RepID=UPI00371DDE28
MGCPPGRKGVSCHQECEAGTFGLDCAQTCHCATSDCNKTTGVCTTTGCSAGWRGTSCNQECHAGTFGLECTQTCHCATSDCNKTTGVCTITGCTAGWTGTSCNQVCTNHTYGRDCTQTCHCANSDCDGRTGACNVPGFCGNNTFGRNCSGTCHCANSDCDKSTGRAGQGELATKPVPTTRSDETVPRPVIVLTQTVTGGLGRVIRPDVWKDGKETRCSQACTYHTFGRDCTQTCYCVNSDCDNRTGVCKVPGCMEGWKGDTCSQGIHPRSYLVISDRGQVQNYTWTFNKIIATPVPTTHLEETVAIPVIVLMMTVTGGLGYAKMSDVKRDGWNAIVVKHVAIKHSDETVPRRVIVLTLTVTRGPGYVKYPDVEKDGRDKRVAKEDWACTNYTFGPDCNQTCHCAYSDCDGKTGECYKSGCDDGWIGKTCTQALSDTQTSDESSNGNGAQIGGIVGAVVAVLLVIVISFIVVRKRRARGQGSASRKYTAPNKNSKATENVYINVGNVESTKDDIPPEVKITETDVDEDEVIYVNGPNDTDVRGETKLLMSELKEIVTAKKENEMYEVEFKSLPHGLKYPYKASNLPKNIPLNRFKTTFPYDHSRVVLKKEKAGSTDYINANFIDGVRNEKAYIATQGPKTNTLEDFWRMIWQNKCGKIVMLANLMELGKIKCITYWAAKESDEEPLELNLFQVKLQEETAYAFYTIRTISVKNKQTNTTRRITQYHFTKWPDHGVPEPFELLQFYKRIKNGRTEHKGPLVVHCSAGIGRTGSYIGLDALLLDGKNSQDIDVFAYVEKMRKGRMNMIQTAKQYEMLHFVLLEGLKVVTTSMSKTDFCRTITDMMEDDVPAQQFAVLDAERPEYKPIEYEAALKNKSKNRNPSILAADNYKVRLMSTQSGYINAVNIRTAFGYILTQHPLDNTTTDFLSLVTQERADTVVSIGPLQ